METINRTDTEHRTAQEMERSSRLPIIGIIVTGIILLGLIAWMTLMMRPNSATAAPPEVQQLLESYNIAWNEYDADAIEGLVTGTYSLHGILTSDEVFDDDMEYVRSSFLPRLEAWEWHKHYDGPYYAVGSDFTMLVTTEGGLMTSPAVVLYPDGDQDAASVIRVVKVGNEWKIAEHAFTDQM